MADTKATIRNIIDRLKDKTALGGYVGGNTVGWIIGELEALIAPKKAGKAKKKSAPKKVKKPAKKATKKK